MEIRRAESRDIPQMQQLLLQVGQVHHLIRPDIFRSGALKYTAEELEILLQDPQRPIFVAMQEDELLGYAFCIHREYDGGASTSRREIYIDDLCVDENCRGQGVASALFRCVTDYAKQLDCAFVTLNVWSGNTGAEKFYEAMGMTTRNRNMEIKLDAEEK